MKSLLLGVEFFGNFGVSPLILIPLPLSGEKLFQLQLESSDSITKNKLN